MTEENASSSGAGEPGADDQNRPAPEPPQKPRGTGKPISIVALLVSLGAAAAAGYLWYQVQVEQRLSQGQQITDLKNLVNTSQVSVTAVEKELDALREQQRDIDARIQNEVETALDELRSGQENLAGRADALSQSIEKVYEDLDRSLDSWALEEIEQLLRIANHSLQLSGDVSTAVAGLELADRRLQEIGNPAFLEVRERLANNITELKALEPVDIAGVSLRLSGMAGKVENLPLDQTTERPISGGDNEAAATGGGGNQWLDAGRELLGDLKQLVRIQNIEEAPKPLLAPEERYFLFNNLRLMLSGAQIAALRRDTATFRDNLDRAAEWVRAYFDTGHQGVEQLLSDIESMRGMELDPDLPDISGSLVTLQEAKKRVAGQ